MKIFSEGVKAVMNGVNFQGKNIQICNGVVIVDGVVQGGKLENPINIEVFGDVHRIETGSGDVKAEAVGSISTGSGDIVCGDVKGNIQTTSGDVSCKDVKGSIRTVDGDVRIG